MFENISPLLLKISRQQNLTSDETKKLFEVIGNEDNTSFFFLAATLGLMAKGPTIDELYGICLDRADRVPKIETTLNPKNITDISGGGGDKIKTLNVSTAASIVAAAGKISVAKQAAAALTGFTGSSDILNEVGVDVSLAKTDPNQLVKCIEKTNFVAYNYSALNPDKFVNFFKWRNKIKELGLKYITPYHLISFAYSPFNMSSRIYGLADDKHLKDVAGVLQKFGYEKGMVLTGVDGLDELSNIGPTKIYEFNKNKEKEYIIQPEDLGVKRAKIEEIKTNSREENIESFLKVLFNQDKGAKRDLVAINAGAIFYITETVKSFKDGTKLALQLIETNKAGEKLEEIVNFYDNQSKLIKLKIFFGL